MSKVSSTELINQHYIRNYEQTKYHRDLIKVESEKQKAIDEESRLLLHRQMQIEIEKLQEYEKLNQTKLYEIHLKGSNIDAYT
jgi:hypothetical protein